MPSGVSVCSRYERMSTWKVIDYETFGKVGPSPDLIWWPRTILVGF